MSLEFYKLLHISGLILLFVGLGGSLISEEAEKPPKLAAILHGVGLLVPDIQNHFYATMAHTVAGTCHRHG